MFTHYLRKIKSPIFTKCIKYKKVNTLLYNKITKETLADMDIIVKPKLLPIITPNALKLKTVQKQYYKRAIGYNVGLFMMISMIAMYCERV